MFGVQGEMVIARRSRPVSTPAELPRELQEVIDSPLASVRTAAVQELTRLLTGRHAGLALAARLALERLTTDDSRTVAAAATAALAEADNTAALVPSEDAAASVPGEALATPVPAEDIPTLAPPSDLEAETPAPTAEPVPLRAETKPPELTADDAPPQDRTEPSAQAEPPSPSADAKAEVPRACFRARPGRGRDQASSARGRGRPGERTAAGHRPEHSGQPVSGGRPAGRPPAHPGRRAGDQRGAPGLGWPVGPGLLLGNVAVSAGGLVSLFVDLLGPDSYGGGFWLEFASSLAEVAAAGLVLMAVVRTEEIRWSRWPMRAAFVWVIVLVAAAAAVAVAFHTHNIAAHVSHQDLTTAIWAAVMALAVPVCALAVRPVRFAIALLGGWLAADVVFLVYHFLYLGYLHGNGVAVSSVPLIVFTLAVVVLVTAAALSWREAFSAGAQGPA
jgi:hypothetical protein